LKVLHLPSGPEISVLARTLCKHGVDATSCSTSSGDYYSYLADVRLNLNEYASKQRQEILHNYFNKALKKYDIFHFHFGKTFFSNAGDLDIIAKEGKKMIAHHRGSEVRMLSVARSFLNPYVRIKSAWTEEKIHKHLQRLSTYIDHAIVPDHELMSYIKPYYKKVHVLPRAFNAKLYRPQYPSCDSKPLIVHAPTHSGVKGTEFVLAAVERLKRRGFQFEFRLIEKLPHKEALQLYHQSTIVIDQLLIGSYANLSMEAMAMGKPVVCYIREDLLSKFPSELPIVNANPDTIYAVLKDLLHNPERWRSLGKQGRRYVEEYHSLDKAAQSLVAIYNQL